MYLKNIAKKIINQILYSSGPHKWPTTFGYYPILMYHRVLPKNHPDLEFEQPGMYVNPETFRMHIKELKKHFKIISLDEIISSIENNISLPNKTCALTFDDGWADNYDYALPVLVEEKVPATIFLVANAIDTKKVLWPEKLGFLLTQLASSPNTNIGNSDLAELMKTINVISIDNIDTSQINDAINNSKNLGDEYITNLVDRIYESLNIRNQNNTHNFLNWKQITDMNNTGLISFGSHTCNHIRLTEDINHETLHTEIVTSKSVIEKKIHKDIHSFCYPNGDHSDNAIRIVKDHYKLAITTKNGWNNLTTDPFLLKRVAIHEDISKTKEAFISRVSSLI